MAIGVEDWRHPKKSCGRKTGNRCWRRAKVRWCAHDGGSFSLGANQILFVLQSVYCPFHADIGSLIETDQWSGKHHKATDLKRNTEVALQRRTESADLHVACGVSSCLCSETTVRYKTARSDKPTWQSRNSPHLTTLYASTTPDASDMAAHLAALL